MKSTADWLKEEGYYLAWDYKEHVWHILFELNKYVYSYCNSAYINTSIILDNLTFKERFEDFDFYGRYLFSKVCTKCIKTTKADIADLKHSMLVTKLTIK